MQLQVEGLLEPGNLETWSFLTQNKPAFRAEYILFEGLEVHRETSNPRLLSLCSRPARTTENYRGTRIALCRHLSEKSGTREAGHLRL